MTASGRIDAFPDPKGPAYCGIIHDIDIENVGALAHCVAHKMEDKMERNREEKTKREGDGGGGDEKSVAKLVDVLFGILLGEPAIITSI